MKKHLFILFAVILSVMVGCQSESKKEIGKAPTKKSSKVFFQNSSLLNSGQKNTPSSNIVSKKKVLKNTETVQKWTREDLVMFKKLDACSRNEALVYKFQCPYIPVHKDLLSTYEAEGFVVLPGGSKLIAKIISQLPPNKNGYFCFDYEWIVVVGNDTVEYPLIEDINKGVLQVKGWSKKGYQPITAYFPDLSEVEGEQLSFLKRVKPNFTVNVFEGESMFDTVAHLMAKDIKIKNLSGGKITLDTIVDNAREFCLDVYQLESVQEVIDKSSIYEVVLNIFMKNGKICLMDAKWKTDYFAIGGVMIPCKKY